MPIAPAAALVGFGAGKLPNPFKRKTEALVPQDIQGLRADQLQLLQQLLQPGGQGLGFFGGLGVPQTDLQRQSAGGISQFLQQPSPEMRTLETARPILEGMLTGTGPQFERDIAMANQQGGRFGSANAILRGEALRNLFNLRTQTAGTLGILSGQAGQADFSRLLQAFGVGGAQAQQGDIEAQRRIQLLQGLLGTAQQTAFNVPIVQNPSAFDQFVKLISAIAQAAGAAQGGGGGG